MKTFINFLLFINAIKENLKKEIEVIPFNKEWLNGAGIPEKAVKLEFNGIKSFVFEDGRNGLIIPTKNGNLIVFEKDVKENSVLISTGLAVGHFFTGAWSTEDLMLFLRIHSDPVIKSSEFKFFAKEFPDVKLQLKALGGDLILPENGGKLIGSIYILPLKPERYCNLEGKENFQDIFRTSGKIKTLFNSPRSDEDRINVIQEMTKIFPEDIMLQVVISSPDSKDWNKDIKGFKFPKFLPAKFLFGFKEDAVINLKAILSVEEDGDIDKVGTEFDIELTINQKKSFYNDLTWNSMIAKMVLALKSSKEENPKKEPKAKKESKQKKEDNLKEKKISLTRVKNMFKKKEKSVSAEA